MPRTLYSRLALLLLLLFGLIGASDVALTVFTTRRYIQEVNQQLNRGLAAHLVAEKILMEDGKVQSAALEDVFHMLMVINPNIELYLLAPDGEVLAFSAPEGSVRRESVALEPIRRFLSGESVLPILGDDPRDRDRRKIFSVAPIPAAGAAGEPISGYLYIVLASEEYDSAAEMLSRSYILPLSLAIAGGGLLFALAGGLAGFGLLTRRLRSLAASMDRFRRGLRTTDAAPPSAAAGPPRDEIDELAASFDGMARHIDAQMRELERNDALRRELVANVSHDLRTPLAALHGYLETLALKEASLTAEERARYVEAALRRSERLGRLIDALFELAKMEAGETRPRLEAFSMAELVQDVAQEFRLRAAERGVDVEVEAAPDLPFVEADIGMLERVLENLLENALRHTPPRGRVSVRLGCDGGRLRVEVEDTGRGIDADDLPRVFDRFYRGGEGDGGSGLGLAISRRILELHDCPIEVKSAPGAGTAFAFGLPVVPANAGARSRDAHR